ncbi:hypothetical protein AB4Z52_21990 [Rhizobium sp. 2YAF20]|uniref:hypothetical protein n=1 Tax=Rhizobium sp. 2YAF20 TaxID=3233027 RepID=UPI003F974FD4
MSSRHWAYARQDDIALVDQLLDGESGLQLACCLIDRFNTAVFLSRERLKLPGGSSAMLSR